jgi:hypothetical protein
MSAPNPPARRSMRPQTATAALALLLAVPFAFGACGGKSGQSVPTTTHKASNSSPSTTAKKPAPLATTTSAAATTTTSAAATTTTSAAASTTTTAAGPSTTGSSSSALASLNKLASSAQHASNSTFSLTYVSTGSSPSTVILEQKPPMQLFKSGTGEVVFDGRKAYYCDTSSTPATCMSYGSAGSSPLGSMMSAYDAGTYAGIMKGWEGLVSAGIAGYHISFSTATFAGQPSDCVTWDYQGDKAKYCVTTSGVLAFVGGGSGSSSSTFELTKYSTSVSAADFSLPKGATITKVP